MLHVNNDVFRWLAPSLAVRTARRHLSFWVFALLLLVPRLGKTQDLVLGDLESLLDTPVAVTTVNMTVQSLRDAPAVVSILGGPELQAWGYRNVAEALRYVVGLYVLDDQIVPNLSMRGVTAGLGGEGGLIKVMIDGTSVNFRPTSGAWLGSELIPITAIKHIEIIKGPASAVHGADAFLGVINIVTLDADQLRSSRLRAAAGPTGMWGEGVVGASDGAWSFLAAIGGESEDRSGLRLPKSSPAPVIPAYRGGDLVARRLERTSRSLYARAAYRPGTSLELFELALSHGGIERGGDFASWAQLSSGKDRDQPLGTVVALSQQSLSNRALVRLGNDFKAQWLGQLSWGGNDPADRIETGSNTSYVERDMDYRAAALKLELAWDPNKAYSIAGGVEYLVDEQRIGGLRWVSRDTGTMQRTTPDLTRVLSNLGAIIQASYNAFGDQLKLTTGLRLDRHSLYGSQLSGRAAAVYRATDSLVIKLLYGSAFKAPSPYLLFTEPLRPGDVVGNPNLRPQKVHTAELFSSYGVTRHLTVSTGLSYSILLDKAEFVPQGINQRAQNIASMKVLVWESEATMIHPSGIRGSLGAELPLGLRDHGQPGYLSQLLDDGLTVYPRYIIRAGLQGRIALGEQLGLRLGSQLLWVGARPASDNNVFQNGGIYNVPPFAELDAFASLVDLRILGDRPTTITLRATNAFNERAVDPGFAGVDLRRPGRGVFVLMDQEL